MARWLDSFKLALWTRFALARLAELQDQLMRHIYTPVTVPLIERYSQSIIRSSSIHFASHTRQASPFSRSVILKTQSHLATRQNLFLFFQPEFYIFFMLNIFFFFFALLSASNYRQEMEKISDYFYG